MIKLVPIRQLFDDNKNQVCDTGHESCHFYVAAQPPNYVASCNHCQRGVPDKKPHRLCPVLVGAAMNAPINDGGAAFPLDGGVSWPTNIGMTLRDYFAAKAMQALVSLPEANGTADYFAAGAYQYADAMIKARSA